MASADVLVMPVMKISHSIRPGVVKQEAPIEKGTFELDYISRDVAKLIAQNLSDVDVNKMLRLNKTWNAVLEDNFFWKQKLLKDYPNESSTDELQQCAEGKMTFKDLYKIKNLGPWATWLKQNLCSPTITMCWIMSKESLAYWGKSSYEARFKPGEVEEVTKSFSDYSKTGITIRSQYYIIISKDSDVMKFRKGNSGGCIVFTKRAMIVCLHDEGKMLQSCIAQVEEIAVRLRESGY